MVLSLSSSVEVTAGVREQKRRRGSEAGRIIRCRSDVSLSRAPCVFWRELRKVAGEVYTCLHHAPLYELVLERGSRVVVIAGKEGEKLKLAVGIK